MVALPVLAADVNPLFLNPQAPLESRVTDYLSRLTLAQKAQVLNHRGTTVLVEGHSLRADQWNQCLNGVKWDRPTTLFPTCIGMAATWNTGLVHEIATVLSTEARAIYNGWHLDPNAPGEHKGLIYRAPVINIGRNPYWGRNHEAWGEDPFLTGRMAVSYVRGLQGDDSRYLKVAATLKHYAVNNVETDRQKLDAKVSERWLREYWLPHFRDAVVEGRAQSLMASYNAINGVPNNINRWLLTDVLKGEWRHEGFVVSDLGGVRTMVQGHAGGNMSFVDAVAQSVMAGCDFSDREYETHIPAAVRGGKLAEARLNDAVARVLRVRFRLGEFDPFEAVLYSRIPPSVVGSPEHRAVALEAARQSIVLLQNRNQFLPLDKSKLKRLAVIGPLADQVVLNNYSGKAGRTVSPLQGLRDYATPGLEVLHAKGCDVLGGAGVRTKVDNEQGFSGGASLKLEAAAAGEFIQFAVTIPAPGNYTVGLQYKSFPTRGTYQLSIDGVNHGPPVDMHAAEARYGQVANFGARELAAGKHQFRFTAVAKNAASTSWTGHFDKLVLGGAKALSFELENAAFTTGGGSEENSIAQAAALARDADVALVFVGTTPQVEHEGRDRKSLGLPGRQEELVKAVFAANPRTVAVQMSAGPLTVPWLARELPAMLQVWWPGEEGGRAIAEALFGEINPAGRLPHTVYASEAQVPPQDEYDISKGFTYMYVRGEPLFPFGHGLSYTKFKYSNLRLSSEQIASDDSLAVSVEVENSGARPGDEVVQLYVKTLSLSATVPHPARELRGFQRVTLNPGEKKTVSFAVPAEKLAFWDGKQNRLAVAPGPRQIQVGASSADIRLTAPFTVVADWFSAPQIRRLRLEILEAAMASLRQHPRTNVIATLWEGNTPYRDARVHLKGASSFRPVDDRPSFTISFDPATPPTFHGLSRIHLNNSVEDPSRLNEILGSEFFRSADYPAPRARHALVELNGRALGLYVVKEGLTKAFLEKNFTPSVNRLYEPKDGYDIDGELDLKLGPTNNPQAPLQVLAAAAREPDLSSRWEKFGQILDRDRFAAFMALEVMIGHRDGYCMARNNFRLVQMEETGRFVFLPHGLDQLFGKPDLTWMPQPPALVARSFLETPEGRRLYQQRFRELFPKVFRLPDLTNRVNQLIANLQRELDRPSASALTTAAADLLERITQRHSYLRQQLALPERQPLKFEQEAVRLEDWRPVDEPPDGKLDRVKAPDGRPSLHIHAGERTAASWRTKVLLPPGRYVFEGRAMVKGVIPNAFHRNQGAGLRVGEIPQLKPHQLVGDTGWTPLAVSFTAAREKEIELICDLFAAQGDAWFDLSSLVLKKLP